MLSFCVGARAIVKGEDACVCLKAREENNYGTALRNRRSKEIGMNKMEEVD